jgi:hypothetical protein
MKYVLYVVGGYAIIAVLFYAKARSSPGGNAGAALGYGLMWPLVLTSTSGARNIVGIGDLHARSLVDSGTLTAAAT